MEGGDLLVWGFIEGWSQNVVVVEGGGFL